MSQHVVVGTTNEEQQGNVQEVGALIEQRALQDVRARQSERPAGLPFTTPPRKIDAHTETGAEIEREALKNTSARQDETQLAGLPHVEAPPPSRAAIAQSAGKTYPPRKE
jgi:hypothetical protein